MASRTGRRQVLRLAAAGALLPASVWGAVEFTPEDLRTDLLRTGLFMVTGGGANTLVRLTLRGLVVVDAKREESFKPLMGQIRRVNRLADLPVRLLVLTSGEDSHSGAAARFVSSGVTLMAASVVAGRFTAATAEPASAAATGHKPPGAVIGFDGLREIELHGARLALMQVGPARGAGDAVVHFPDLRVTAVGPLYAEGEPRSLLRDGGSLAGWAKALDEVLKLDLGLVVPAQGPPIGRAELVALRARLPPVA